MNIYGYIIIDMAYCVHVLIHGLNIILLKDGNAQFIAIF